MNKKSTKSKFVTKKIAVGNKTDLRGKVFELKTEDKQKILDFKCKLINSSALANESVQEVFKPTKYIIGSSISFGIFSVF